MRKIKLQTAVLNHLIEMIKPERLNLKPVLARARVAFVRILAQAYAKYEQAHSQILLDFVPKDNDGKPLWFEGNEGRFAPDVQLADDPELLSDCKLELKKLMESVFELEETEDNTRLFERLVEIFENLDIDFNVEEIDGPDGVVRLPREELIYTDVCEQLGIGY